MVGEVMMEVVMVMEEVVMVGEVMEEVVIEAAVAMERW